MEDFEKKKLSPGEVEEKKDWSCNGWRKKIVIQQLSNLHCYDIWKKIDAGLTVEIINCCRSDWKKKFAPIPTSSISPPRNQMVLPLEAGEQSSSFPSPLVDFEGTNVIGSIVYQYYIYTECMSGLSGLRWHSAIYLAYSQGQSPAVVGQAPGLGIRSR